MNPALPKIVELMLRSLASKEGISIEYKVSWHITGDLVTITGDLVTNTGDLVMLLVTLPNQTMLLVTWSHYW